MQGTVLILTTTMCGRGRLPLLNAGTLRREGHEQHVTACAAAARRVIEVVGGGEAVSELPG